MNNKLTDYDLNTLQNLIANHLTRMKIDLYDYDLERFPKEWMEEDYNRYIEISFKLQKLGEQP